jgi:AMP-binding enzyme C-terminal domain
MYGIAEMAYNNSVGTNSVGVKTETHDFITNGLSASCVDFKGEREIASGLKANVVMEFEVDPCTETQAIKIRMYRHPAVLAAAVVAKPDARWGETPCAFVELKADAQVTAEQIVAHCKQHLAGFKVPRAVVFGELPKTSTCKIQKFELRKQAGSAAAINV